MPYTRLRDAPRVVLGACAASTKRLVASFVGWRVAAGVAAALWIAPDTTRWFCLGVLSSCGFGFGFNTGPLFLFPHIASVAARQPFVAACREVARPALAWGAGTAVGELPPFLAGPFMVEAAHRNSRSLGRVVEWSRRVVESLGATGIFLLSCWPNMFFDCAGIVAGTSGMPAWKFLASTLAGKALVKAPLQAIFFVATTQGILDYGEDDADWSSNRNADLYADWFRALAPWARIVVAGVICAAVYGTVEAVGNMELERRERE